MTGEDASSPLFPANLADKTDTAHFGITFDILFASLLVL